MRVRARKKQKRLDAICEKVYNSNRLLAVDESNEGDNVPVESEDREVRRSSRVRKAPDVLDVSPPESNEGDNVPVESEDRNVRRNSRVRKTPDVLDVSPPESTERDNVPMESEDREVRRSSRVRKAPDVLDVSPPPLRKRQRVDNGSLINKNERLVDGRKWGDQLKEKEKEKGSEGVESDDGEGMSGWKSRLRSKAHDVGSDGFETLRSSGRKKMFFDDFYVSKEEFKDIDKETRGKEEGVDGVKSPLGRSKRGANNKGKRSLHSKLEEHSIVPVDSDTERNDRDVGEGLMALDQGAKVHGNAINAELLEEKGKTTNGDKEQSVGAEALGEAEFEKEGVNCLEEVEIPVDELGNGVSCASKDTCPVDIRRKPLEEEVVVKVDGLRWLSTDNLHKSRVREGRRCGLCGRGNDGKPPKRLTKDSAGSDNEAYGESSSEEANYDVWDGFGDESGWLGRLLGPIHDRFGIAGVFVHQHCAVWSPEVYFAGLGCLKNVRAALVRGRALKCSRCGRPGATIGCRVDRCPKTYHLPCGRADGCVFDHRKFLIACIDHQHLFQPHGNHYLHRIKKLKTKKLKLQIRKLSQDAWRKDFDAEEKWLENNGEDEEFLRREGKRLHRDILRIAPVYIGGSSSDSGKLYQGWESVAGLQNVVRCMKEVVLLPLLYPELFSSLGLTPPRGVLLHGYPGTGKTLIVRALIGSCARGDRRIAYFARKGADCLGKYVGDAERQLRLLFQVAEKSQPSIIFFDEIDGLAPCRTRQQDQTHNSVVSTLLALMDGLKSRGSVIVIGATNRPDSVDPALRRPGRFDREIYFPLPSVKDRAAILSVHTQRWPKPVSGTLLNLVARKTDGFAGADLQALCTQAAMIALKRNCAWKELMCGAEKSTNNGKHLPLFSFPVEEKDWLDALACAPPPCSRREAGMAANDVISSPLHVHLSSCLLQPLSYLLVSLFLDERILLPPLLYKAAKLIKSAIMSALGRIGKSNDFWWSYLPELIEEADISSQIQQCLSTADLLVGASISGNFDVLNDDIDAGNEFELCKASRTGVATRLKNGSYLSGRISGFRVLITGNPKSGQRHLASCLLYGFVGCVEIQKVDLATISQEGHGDVIEGMTQILLKCLSKDLCVIYMPRIDLWALEMLHQDDESEHDGCENTCKSADTAGPCDSNRHASQLWNSFVEQVESMHLSGSLMILATSEVPSKDLPDRISQFFTRDVLNLKDSVYSEHTIPRFHVQLNGNFDRDTMISSSGIEITHSLVQQYVQLLHNRIHATDTQKDYKTGDALESNAETENQSNITNGVVLGTASNGDTSCNGDETLLDTNGDGSSVPMLKTFGHKDDEVKLCHSQDAINKIQNNNRTVKGKSSSLLAISSLGYQILRYPHFSELCWATSKLKEGPCTDTNGPWKGWPFNSCIIHPNNSVEKVALGRSSGNLKNKEHSGAVRGLIAVGLLAYRGVYTSVREVAFEVRKVLELLVEQVSAKILGGKDRYQFLRLLSQVAYLEDMVNSWAYTLQSLEPDSQITYPRQNNAEKNRTSEQDLAGGDAYKPNGSQNSRLDLPNSDARITVLEETCRDFVPSAHSALGSSKQPNGMAKEGSIFPCEDYTPRPDEPVNFTLNHENGISAVSKVTCLYSCCSDCLRSVYALIHKFLTHEMEANGRSWTVEDVHDVVAASSVKILAAVRDFCNVQSVGNSEIGVNSRDENVGKVCTCPDAFHIQSKEASYKKSAVECSFHSERKRRVKAKTKACSGLGLNICFRDNVLIPCEVDKDVLLQCRFENLCLGALIECVSMIKQPLD